MHSISSSYLGVDGILVVMLKYFSLFVNPYLTPITKLVINCFVESSYFLGYFLVVGRPIPKIAKPTYFSNLRIFNNFKELFISR